MTTSSGTLSTEGGVRSATMPSRLDKMMDTFLRDQLVSLHQALSTHAEIRRVAELLRAKCLTLSTFCEEEQSEVEKYPERVVGRPPLNDKQAVVPEIEDEGHFRLKSALRQTSTGGNCSSVEMYEQTMDSIAFAAEECSGFSHLAGTITHETGLIKPLLSDLSESSVESSMSLTKSQSLMRHPAEGWTKEIRAAKLKRRMSLFPQLQYIKDVVQESLSKPRYNVEDLYRKTGFWQQVARSAYFNNFTLLVIVFNTIWMAIDTDYNTASILCKAPLVFQIADNFSCSVFVFELMARFLAFEYKSRAFKDAYFVFDAFLVALMVWETWIMVAMYLVLGEHPGGVGGKSMSVLRFCRVFRLMRVARTARLLHQCPELIILAKSIAVGVRSVMTILVLLFIVIYVFAIIFTQLLSGTDVGGGKFYSVAHSMNFLLLQVLCGFDAQFINDLWVAGPAYYVLFLIFLLLTSLTIMNMLIGILCDVVSTVASLEKDEAFARELETQVLGIARSLDSMGNDCIDEAAFSRITREPALAHMLHELGVDVVAISDYASFVFSECGSLSHDDFLHMVSQFRGSKEATVKDCMDLRKFFAMEMALVKCSIEACVAKTDRDIKRHEAMNDARLSTHISTASHRHELEETRWSGRVESYRIADSGRIVKI